MLTTSDIAVLNDEKKLPFFVILTISTATLFDKAINYWCCISSLTRCLSTQHQFFLCLTHKQNIFPLSAYIKFFLFSLLPQWKASLKSMWRFNNFWHFLTTTTTAIVSWTLRVWAFTLYLHGCYEILGYVFFFIEKRQRESECEKTFSIIVDLHCLHLFLSAVRRDTTLVLNTFQAIYQILKCFVYAINFFYPQRMLLMLNSSEMKIFHACTFKKWKHKKLFCTHTIYFR